MGLAETLRIGVSYGRSQLHARSPEVTLEDFFINRFGNRLYRTFFKDYTEKVWGGAMWRNFGGMGSPARQGIVHY